MRSALLVLVLSTVIASRAAIVGKPVEYSAGGDTLKGYVAYDDKFKEKRPGILVVHEWWGNNDYSRRRANMLAELGYVAFAVDMYGNGRLADNPGDAGKLAGEVGKNIPLMVARFTAALDELKKNDAVDASRIGAIGYCFGVGVVLNMARQGLDLKGVVSFHGSLATQSPAEKGKVKARIHPSAAWSISPSSSSLPSALTRAGTGPKSPSAAIPGPTSTPLPSPSAPPTADRSPEAPPPAPPAPARPPGRASPTRTRPTPRPSPTPASG